MKTQIFENYTAFYNREDKEVNGVSQQFANAYPDYEKQNETNKGCWNCSGCSRCSRCSRCSDCSDCSGCSRCSDCSDCSRCSGCSGCSDCSGCSGCSRCSRCSDCSGCSGCSDCSGCSGCSGKTDIGKQMVVPVIEEIHSKVLEAVSKPNALDMGDWHTCDTTHCRAGWVVTLAGKEGKDLEDMTSTIFAAMMIYKKSSPINVSPTRFFESNTVAMEDMERCANEESKTA